MNEVVMRYNKTLEVDRSWNAPKNFKGSEYRSKNLNQCNDNGISVLHGNKSFLLELEAILNDLSKGASKIYNANYGKPWFKEVAITLRVNGLRDLCTFVLKSVLNR